VLRKSKKNGHNEIVLYEVIRMFYFLNNTVEKEEQCKKKEMMMKNREKQLESGRQNKLEIIYVKVTLEG
jgi:hypothetical protein